VFNIEQSVHYYHVRNADSPTPWFLCLRYDSVLVPLMEPQLLIRAQGALGAVYEHRGGLRF
jgi:hypothetical protein